MFSFAVSLQPTRCVTQYIRFPVRGSVRVASDLEDKQSKGEVLGVVAMDVSLGTPAVILGVLPADSKGAKSTTLSQALAHMKPYKKAVQITKPHLGLKPAAIKPPLSKPMVGKPLSKPTTRSATGALPEDKAVRTNTNPIGTGERSWSYLRHQLCDLSPEF